MDIMMYKTPQESFWAGEFGTDYIDRNNGASRVAAKTALFSQILSRTCNVNSVLELGANIGLNIHAVRNLLPDSAVTAVEINKEAVGFLKSIGNVDVFYGSMLDFTPTSTFDFVFTKTVLIHIEPKELPDVYKRMHEASNRYICVIEYYNPSPVTVTYRDHQDRLFKRDFAGEMLELYPDLSLVDYGFVYKRDPNFPLDDVTWFLLEKIGR